MRKYFIALMLSIFFAGAAYYTISTMPPLNYEAVAELVAAEEIEYTEELLNVLNEVSDRGLIAEYLNWRNVSLAIFTVSMSAMSLFVFLHLLIERIFLAKFYQNVSLPKAARRAIWLGLSGVSGFFLLIYRGEWWLGVLVVILFILVEIFITNWRKHPEEASGEGEKSFRGRIIHFFSNLQSLAKVQHEKLNQNLQKMSEESDDADS